MKYSKAYEISQKFLKDQRTKNVVLTIAPKLIEVKKATQAAELFFKVDLFKECIDAFISAEEWTKARKVAEQLDRSYDFVLVSRICPFSQNLSEFFYFVETHSKTSRLISYVEEKYKKSVYESGDIKAVANVDAIAALDMYVNKNQWDECIKEAEKHVRPLFLHLLFCISSSFKNLTTNRMKKFYINTLQNTQQC